MANEEVLGPRKTIFVLVIVVACFAVLWPRILSPLLLGTSRDQLKPNKFDRDAGCCEVMFASEVAVLELLNEVCGSASHADGKLSPLAAAECRKTVNETCGVDIAAFLKRSDNVGKTSKMLLDTLKASNSTCLRDYFGVPVWSLGHHQAINAWIPEDTLKQERSPIRVAGPHPALRERGRAIPADAPPAPRPSPLPPHLRVRSSPLSVYFELDIKPPPIPGMRPPLGSPGGPVQAPKSSMGFVMPIYTICIIVFFVYTLSKILFKRVGTTPYEQVSPDPQFRRRVFRDDSRTTPDKLVVTAISGLVAEVQQQMEAGYALNQQRQDVQDNHARPYTNGTILHSGPVQIVASEYREPSEEKSPEPAQKEPSPETKEAISEPKETTPEPKEPTPELKESSPEPSPEPKDLSTEPKEVTPEPQESTPELKELTPESGSEVVEEEEVLSETEESPEELIKSNRKEASDLIKLTESIESQKESIANATEDFLNQEKENLKIISTTELEQSSNEEKQSTPELLEEALQEDSIEADNEETKETEQENASVKVIGMEVTAHTADGGAWPRAEPPPVTPMPPHRPPHEAEQVKSIYLETEIPQQSRVLVAEFADQTKPPATKHAPMVVSGKMTLSLIQDAPRETPERDPESTMDDFTTASGVTQPAAEKEDDLSDEEFEEEIEVEEIEEEIEEEEEEVEDEEPDNTEEPKEK